MDNDPQNAGRLCVHKTSIVTGSDSNKEMPTKLDWILESPVRAIKDGNAQKALRKIHEYGHVRKEQGT